jgi:Protein of unknown function (DUF3618)
MTASLTRIERDIEETRSRLYDTIDRIQDRLTVPGMVDEVLGSSGAPRFEAAFQQALEMVRRNPVPVLIVAAGIGWLIHRTARARAPASVMLIEGTSSDMPFADTGRGPIYDSEFPTARPQPA